MYANKWQLSNYQQDLPTHNNQNASNYHDKLKGMEHVPNIFMSFDKYLFLEVINILI